MRELVAELRRGKWLIVSLVLLATAGAALAVWLLPKSYEAEILLSPVSSSTGGSGLGAAVGSVMSQFGSIASMAGLGGATDSKKSESLAVLQSEALTERYIKDNNLLPILYAKDWDARNQRWTVTDLEKIPTLWKANQYFKSKVRTVATDVKTGLVTLTITWRDPAVAAQWANDLVALANDYLRNKAIQESERNIDYLNQQSAKTDLLSVRQATASLLTSEINKEMMARGSSEYAFKILDPAQPPEKPHWPRPMILFPLAIAGALGLAVFIAFVRVAWLRD